MPSAFCPALLARRGCVQVAKVTVALPGGGDSGSAASLASALSFGSGGSVGPHIGALSTRRALIRAVASASDGTR